MCVDKVHFHCPICDGSFFGSYTDEDGVEWVMCHADDCIWRGKRMEQEHFISETNKVCGHGYAKEHCPLHGFN